MKFEVVKIGKPSQVYIPLVDDYRKRISRYIDCSSRFIKSREGKNRTAENELVRRRARSCRVVLDRHGKGVSTRYIAEKMNAWSDDSTIEHVSFIVGGPLGIEKEVVHEADHVWKLSDCIFPTDIAWLIFWEQIYRACTINKGIPYHHENN